VGIACKIRLMERFCRHGADALDKYRF